MPDLAPVVRHALVRVSHEHVAATRDVPGCGVGWAADRVLVLPVTMLPRVLCDDEHSCACCRFDGVLPSAASEAAQPALAELNEKVVPLVEQYTALMEKIKLKDGIRMAMNVSFAGNKFFQVSCPAGSCWDGVSALMIED